VEESTRPMSVRECAEWLGVQPKTVRGWITRGIMARGRRVRLGAACLGGRLTVTAEGYAEFTKALARAKGVVAVEPPLRSTKAAAMAAIKG
jgi:hypothetical protein